MLCTSCMTNYPARAFYVEALDRFVARCANCRGAPVSAAPRPTPEPKAEPVSRPVIATQVESEIVQRTTARLSRAASSLRSEAPPVRARRAPPPAMVRVIPSRLDRPFTEMRYDNFHYVPSLHCNGGPMQRAVGFVLDQLPARGAHGRY